MKPREIEVIADIAQIVERYTGTYPQCYNDVVSGVEQLVPTATAKLVGLCTRVLKYNLELLDDDDQIVKDLRAAGVTINTD
ncbi:MAG: hypothetical protein GY832_23775 [Chloroflexi bacterium]|nr:hypothetical protein [Chloroflexota bacterium]